MRVRSRLTIAALAGLLAVGCALAGCCTSMSRANAIVQDSRRQNRLQAEPAMRAAARALGAELLSVFPEQVDDCDLPGRPEWVSRTESCIQWNPKYQPLLTLRDRRGATHQALPIAAHDWYYARLARRGDDLVLLVPKLTRRQVDRRAQCECDGMPRMMPSSPPRVVFIVDGEPNTVVQKVEVSVTEAYVSFDCRTYLM